MKQNPLAVNDTHVEAYLKSHGENPADYRIVELEEYRDVMNSGYFEHQGRKAHVVSVDVANEATGIRYDFTHTGIQVLNDQNEAIGESSVGLGYDDLAKPTAFSVEDLHLTLKIPQS